MIAVSKASSNTGKEDPSSQTEPLEEILQDAINCSAGNNATTGEVLDVFGTQSLGPIILLSGLLIVIPMIGMLPGVPFIIGTVVVLTSAQYVFGRQSIWMPEHIRKLSIKRKKLKAAKDKSSGWLNRLDKLFMERLTFMTGGVMDRVSAVVILFLGLSMFPLGMVPGGVALPGWAMIFFGVGLTARDGLFLLVGYTVTFGAAYLLYQVVPAIL